MLGSGVAPQPFRSLVVDDDDAVASFLGTVLGSLGAHVRTAADGRQAEAALRAERFDLVFLDMRLPQLSGEMLLGLVRQGMLPQQGAVVLMSGCETRPAPEQLAAAGALGFLAKPFAPDDVRACVEYAMSSLAAASPTASADASEPGPVLLAGDGLWAEALALVVRRGNGVLCRAHSLEDARRALERERPRMVVAGPPLGDADLPAFCEQSRTAGVPVLAMIPRADASLRSALLAAGAERVLVLPSGLGEASTELAVRAGLSRRAHRRVPFASSVFIHAGDLVCGAFAVDLGEGGLGLTAIEEAPRRREIEIEFGLPGDEHVIRAGSELAWTREADGGGLNAGLRFTRLAEPDRRRIRDYVAGFGHSSGQP